MSAFSVDASTGVLTSVTGSPFDTGGAAGPGIGLAATRDTRCLYAANGLSQDITTFGINPDGSLTRVGDPVSTFNQPDGIKVTPDNVPLLSADGSLTLTPGSPVSTGQPSGLLALTVFPAKSCPSATALRGARR
jgi:hypothetical protein